MQAVNKNFFNIVMMEQLGLRFLLPFQKKKNPHINNKNKNY